MARRKNKWKNEYEREKRKLQDKQLSHVEYEKEIKKIAKRMKV
mgnify:CR=1 FL=1